MQIFYTNTTHSIQSKNTLEKYLEFLSPEERLRFETTPLQKNKLQFLFGRILLKSCLAEIYNCSIQDLKFKVNKNGLLTIDKPINNISFSLSHSGDLVLLALNNTQIGVDLEFMRERKYLQIADYFFEPEEAAFLRNHPSRENFYTLWTLKESFIKFLGERLYSTKARLQFELDIIHKTIKTIKDQEYKFSSYQLSENYIVSLSFTNQESNKNKKVEIFQVPELLPKLTKEIYTQSKLLYAS